MTKTFLRVLSICLMLLPVFAFASEVTGTLDSFSIRAKTMVVNKVEYSVDLENLHISYKGGYMGVDALERGIRVLLIIDDELPTSSSDRIVSMQIISYKAELDS